MYEVISLLVHFQSDSIVKKLTYWLGCTYLPCN